MGATYNVNTSFNVNIQFRMADLGRRIGAYLLDTIIKSGYFLLMMSSIGFSIGASNELATIVFFVIALLPLMFYSFLFERFMNGQSPGKRALDIKVVSLRGGELSTGQIALRWLFRIIDFQIGSGLVALLCVALSAKTQRVGDMVADTAVVDLRKKPHTLGYHEIEPDYIPHYPEAQYLKPQDVKLIQDVLKNQSENNFTLITTFAAKLEEKLVISKREGSRDFLRTLVRDYTYYSLKKKEF